MTAARYTDMDMDDKNTTASAESSPITDEPTWVDEMKQQLEDYIEEQGIYIRQ